MFVSCQFLLLQLYLAFLLVVYPLLVQLVARLQNQIVDFCVHSLAVNPANFFAFAASSASIELCRRRIDHTLSAIQVGSICQQVEQLSGLIEALADPKSLLLPNDTLEQFFKNDSALL